MQTIYHIFDQNILHSIGWTFVHSIWQGILLALALQCCLIVIKNKAASTRYWVSFAFLTGQLFASTITFFILYSEHKIATNIAPFQLNYESSGNFQNPVSFLQDAELFINNHLSIITFFWISGFVILLLKLALSYIITRRLRNASYTIHDENILSIIQNLKSKIGWKRDIQFHFNDKIMSPIAIGFFKPMILMPFSVCCQLNTQEITAILAHELAHIKRNDYLVNIVQSLMEVLFYYHPAIWWMSNTIRNERENCCDDMALGYTSDQISLAKALYKIRALQIEQTQKHNQLVLSVTGNNKKYLLIRVKRILNNQQKNSNIMEKLITAVLLICAITLFSFDKKMNNGKIFHKIASVVKDSIPNPPAPPPPPPAPNAPPPPPPAPPAPPVQPKTSKLYYNFNNNGKDIELEKTNNEISMLKVDGKTIDQKDYEKYHDITSRAVDPNQVSFKFNDGGLSADEIVMDDFITDTIELLNPDTKESKTKIIKSRIILKNKKDNDNETIIFGDSKGDKKTKIYKLKKGDDENNISITLDTDFEDEISNDDNKKLFNKDFTHKIKLNIDSLKKIIDLSIGDEKAMRLKLKKLGDELKFSELNINGEVLKKLENLKGFAYKFNTGDDLSQSEKIRKQLIEDGIVKDGEKLKFIISDDSFKVNGKKQSAEVHQKYLKLIGIVSKKGEKSTIKIEYSKD